MTDKKKIASLDAAIRERKAALEEAQREVKAAADEPARLVLAEKAARRISAQLQALEQAKAAASYTPPEPTDKAELLQGLEKYYVEQADRVGKVEQAITRAESERYEIEKGLQEAAAACDTKTTLLLSDRKSDNEAERKALIEMRERMNALPLFPDGALTEEWAGICEKAKPGWDAAVLRVETLAAAYKSACSDLLKMHDALVSAREDLARLAGAPGSAAVCSILSPVFTTDLDCEKLIVQKGDYARLSTLRRPFIGFAL